MSSFPAACLERFTRRRGGAEERFTLTGAHYRRAQLLAKLGRKDDASAAYQAALAVEPKFELASKELEALKKG